MKHISLALILGLISANAMANNVSAQISSNDLNIQGDALGNQVRIDRTLLGVRVVGLNGTLVNGLPSVNFIVTGPLVNVNALMGGGDDAVTFRNVGNLGDVIVEGGQGNDAMSVLGSSSDANILLKGEAGNDRLTVDNSAAAGDFELDGGQGANVLRGVRSSTGYNFTTIGGDLNDRIDLADLTHRRIAQLVLGQGRRHREHRAS